MPADIDAQILSTLNRIEARLEAMSGGQAPNRQQKEGGAGPKPSAASAVIHVPGGGNEEEVWLDLPEEQVVAVLAPLANAQRVKLLKALYLGIAESGQLKEFTGLTGGQLYHHLKELALAKFLSRQVRGEYRLSAFGHYAFSALMILTTDLLAEELEEEVVTPEEIELE